MRRKSAGNTTDIAWREIRTTCSSIGWRNASSACGGNSPSSSRNSTPRCASVTPMFLGGVVLCQVRAQIPLAPVAGAGTQAAFERLGEQEVLADVWLPAAVCIEGVEDG